MTPAYEVDLGSVKPSVFATLQYTGDRFSDVENNQLLPHFYQLDAGVSVDVAERVKLQVTGNNLTNEVGLTEGNPRIIGSQGSGPIGATDPRAVVPLQRGLQLLIANGRSCLSMAGAPGRLISTRAPRWSES